MKDHSDQLNMSSSSSSLAPCADGTPQPSTSSELRRRDGNSALRTPQRRQQSFGGYDGGGPGSIHPYVSMPFSVYDALLQNRGSSPSTTAIATKTRVSTTTRTTTVTQNHHKTVTVLATEQLVHTRRAEAERKRALELLLEQVAQMMKKPRTAGGLGDKVGRADVATLLASFALCSDEESCDDFWLELQVQAGGGGSSTTAYVGSSDAVARALAARGARPTQELATSSSAAAEVCLSESRKAVFERITAHTASSRQRTGTSAREEHRASSAPRRRSESPDVHKRLAMPKKPPAALPEDVAQLRDRERRECTFAPTISRTAAQAQTRFADPTHNSASRAALLKKATQNIPFNGVDGPIDDLDVSPVRQVKMQTDDLEVEDCGDRFATFYPRPSWKEPPPLPTEVPKGYVESVARLRRAAAVQREQQHRFVEYGFWRSSPHREHYARDVEEKRFANKPILRIPLAAAVPNTTSSGPALSVNDASGASSTRRSDRCQAVDIRLLQPSPTPRRAVTGARSSPGKLPLAPSHRAGGDSVRQLAAQFCDAKGLKHHDPSRAVIEETAQHVLRQLQRSKSPV